MGFLYLYLYMTNTHDEVLLNKSRNKKEHITVYDSVCWVLMYSGVFFGQ
jgi:hypothetical protein